MSRRHRTKDAKADEAFQEQGFVWESGASVGADDFDLLTILTGERKNDKKHRRAP